MPLLWDCSSGSRAGTKGVWRPFSFSFQAYFSAALRIDALSLVFIVHLRKFANDLWFVILSLWP